MLAWHDKVKACSHLLGSPILLGSPVLVLEHFVANFDRMSSAFSDHLEGRIPLTPESPFDPFWLCLPGMVFP